MFKNLRNLCRDYWLRKKDGEAHLFFEEFEGALESKALKPDDCSIRTLFESLVEGGSELVRAFDPRQGGGVILQEASGVVDTSAFSNIMGQIIYSRFMEAYRAPEFIFSRLIPTVQTQFNGEKIPGVSNIGDEVEEIGENEPYPTIGLNEDWIETPATVKRGVIDGVTKEAIFFDRTGLVLQKVGQIGTAYGINQEKRAIDCVIDENTTKHRYKWKGTSYATYQSSAPWVNIAASNALVDWTDIEAVELLFADMTDPNTGEPVIITPRHLIVTPQLKYTAMRVTRATTIRVATPGYATTGNPTETETSNPIGPFEILSSAMLKSRLGTDTSYFLGDVSRAFAYMENWPMRVEQAPANAEAEFTRDVVSQYKVSGRGAYATMEPRFMAKATA